MILIIDDKWSLISWGDLSVVIKKIKRQLQPIKEGSADLTHDFKPGPDLSGHIWFRLIIKSTQELVQICVTNEPLIIYFSLCALWRKQDGQLDSVKSKKKNT